MFSTSICSARSLVEAVLLPVAHPTRPLLLVSSLGLNKVDGLVARAVHASGGASINLTAEADQEERNGQP
jgi:hypothetical protein